MFRRRLWQVGQEAGVAVRASLAVLECVIERGEELEPPLDSGTTVSRCASAFQCLVVGQYTELGRPKVPSEAFVSPNDAAGLQIKRSPMPIRVERSSADIRDGFHGTVRLFLFEGGTKPVDARVVVHVERTWAVSDSVPIGENQNRRSRKLRQDFSRKVFHSGRERNLTPFRRSELIGRSLLDKSRNNLR